MEILNDDDEALPYTNKTKQNKPLVPLPTLPSLIFMSLVFSRLDIMLQPKAIGQCSHHQVSWPFSCPWPLALVSRRLKLVQLKFCPAETFSQVPVRLTSRTWNWIWCLKPIISTSVITDIYSISCIACWQEHQLNQGGLYIQGKDKMPGMWCEALTSNLTSGLCEGVVLWRWVVSALAFLLLDDIYGNPRHDIVSKLSVRPSMLVYMDGWQSKIPSQLTALHGCIRRITRSRFHALCTYHNYNFGRINSILPLVPCMHQGQGTILDDQLAQHRLLQLQQLIPRSISPGPVHGLCSSYSARTT